ncbi:MAG: COG4315 family predicted lipoprotein [Solirubrobacterales bacterium]
MNRKSYVLAPLAALMAVALVIAGCGGGSSTTSASNSGGSEENASSESSASENKPASSESSGGSAAVVSLGHTKVGMVLVDSNGMTLYDFHKDKGTTSSCYGACAKAWPPMTTEGKPTVGNGASASKLGTTERKDGTMQVTYAGHPLYTFVEDKKPGEANGNDTSAFGAQWYALKGNGEEAGG